MIALVLAFHGVWGQRDPRMVCERRSEVRPWSPLLVGAPQRCAVEGHRDLRRLRCCRQTSDHTVGPGSQVRFDLVSIHVPKERVECRGTGGVVGKAEGLGESRPIIASPCGHGTLAAIATQHRTTRQSEDGTERMPFATRLTKVRDRSEHFDERTGMCYHQAPPTERVVVHVRDAGQAKPHLEHNPLSLLGACYATPRRKLGYPLKAGQLTYDCRYSTMHGMPVTGGRGLEA